MVKLPLPRPSFNVIRRPSSSKCAIFLTPLLFFYTHRRIYLRNQARVLCDSCCVLVICGYSLWQVTPRPSGAPHPNQLVYLIIIQIYTFIRKCIAQSSCLVCLKSNHNWPLKMNKQLPLSGSIPNGCQFFFTCQSKSYACLYLFCLLSYYYVTNNGHF